MPPAGPGLEFTQSGLGRGLEMGHDAVEAVTHALVVGSGQVGG